MNKIIAAAVAVLLMTTGPAVADRIDGDWCYKDGRHMTIDGAKIKTPGGTMMTGDYDRHGFRYVAPEGEPGAGAVISMVQLDDETINVIVGKAPAVQVWNRCKLRISRGSVAPTRPLDIAAASGPLARTIS